MCLSGCQHIPFTLNSSVELHASVLAELEVRIGMQAET